VCCVAGCVVEGVVSMGSGGEWVVGGDVVVGYWKKVFGMLLWRMQRTCELGDGFIEVETRRTRASAMDCGPECGSATIDENIEVQVQVHTSSDAAGRMSRYLIE
jgi:hypothetical protein